MRPTSGGMFSDSGHFGIGWPFLLAALVMAVLMSIFAGPLYRLDLRIVYGRAFDKLREVPADMEGLRA